jgi:hypothetical protein
MDQQAQDALFDLLDAMIWGGSVSSFAMLSQLIRSAKMAERVCSGGRWAAE